MGCQTVAAASTRNRSFLKQETTQVKTSMHMVRLGCMYILKLPKQIRGGDELPLSGLGHRQDPAGSRQAGGLWGRSRFGLAEALGEAEEGLRGGTVGVERALAGQW